MTDKYKHTYTPTNNKYNGDGGYTKSIIVVHTSEPGPYAPGKDPGTAQGLGHYNATQGAGSYHLAVDQYGNVDREMDDSDRAWHAGEICNNEGYAICAVGWSGWTRDDWLSMPAMLDSMAIEIVKWCKKGNIPPNFVPADQLVKDVWGVCGHVDTAHAWHQTNHTDPGHNFPYDVVLGKVKKYLDGDVPVQPGTKTAIETCRDANAWLGNKITGKNELSTLDGKGRFADYEHGSVYWYPDIGAFAIPENIYAKYKELKWEQGILGYPTKAAIFNLIDSGQAQAFQNGVIYWTRKTGAHEVQGAILDLWSSTGYEKGPLRYPVSDEHDADVKNARVSDFQEGCILWSPKTDAHETHGLIHKAFVDGGAEKTYGLPLTNETKATRPGRYNLFQNAAIYWKQGAPKAVALTSMIKLIWDSLGHEDSQFGFPVDESKHGHTTTVTFENGTISCNAKTGHIEMTIIGKRV